MPNNEPRSPEEAGLVLKAFEDDGVGAVYDGGVEAGKVDLGGRLAVVSHAFADHRDRNAFGFCS